MKTVKIGNVTYNLKYFANHSKEQFIQENTGKIVGNLDEIWDKLQPHLNVQVAKADLEQAIEQHVEETPAPVVTTEDSEQEPATEPTNERNTTTGGKRRKTDY